MSEKEKEVLGYFFDHEVELCARPFLKAARSLHMDEGELVGLLKGLEKRGIIKYLRGVIDHVNAGYRENALVAWRSSSPGKENGEKMARDLFLTEPRITHCYKRRPHKTFNFNLYSMMHAKTRKEIVDFAKRCARRFKLDKEVLFTEKELKKTKLDIRGIIC